MDDDFAFSSCTTRQEWEVDYRRREEFSKEFMRDCEEREQLLAQRESLEPARFFAENELNFKTTRIVPRPDFDSAELNPAGAQKTSPREPDDRDNSDCN